MAIKKGLRRGIGVALATGMMTAASVVLPAQATGAQTVSCYGDYCSGQDPADSGCAADAVTVSEVADEVASLQLRWSPTCKTNWARLIVYKTGKKLSPQGGLYAHQETGYEQSRYVPIGTGGTYWTPMIYSPHKKVRATFYDGGWVWNDTNTDYV
ncbi:DUF2690 domain-containing protein [Streptomyces sp. 351MFTsu5.1]|uniref:DUF2690 domain-containing protein n=1 Tax=Streptomyces sp. 351MFTsu5.1 TaxID=1172180 RepID=UPI001319E971|nr:DUF2690 domain-containing protein [Streptomyces sp. 351MFTsu5.1]